MLRRLRLFVLLLAFAAAAIGVHLALPDNLPGPVTQALYLAVALVLGAAAYRLASTVASWRNAAEAYRLVFEDASDAIAIASPDLGVLEVNSRACQTLGYSREELLKMNIRDLLFPEDLVGKPLRFEDVLTRGKTVRHERRFRRKDGASITTELSVRALRDGRLIAIGRDVTARTLAEEELKRSEALARSVVYTAVDGIITADEQGIIQSFNPAAERLFGYAAEDVIGKNLNLLMPSPHREAHDDYIRTYLATGDKKIIGFVREVTAVLQDGTRFPFELAVSEMLLPGGRMFTGILHDISQRKLAEANLKETNATLEALIKTSPLAITVLDLEGKVLSWNPAAERIFGWSAEEVLGRPLPVVAEEERSGFIEILARNAGGEPMSGSELRRKRKDGSPVDLSLWTAPLCGPEGQVNAVLSIIADITQRKALAEQFRHAQKMEAVGRLAGGIAHDFNNILTVITGYAHMVLERAGSDPQTHGEVAEILKAAEHASALTGQLLVFSRHQVAKPEVLDLRGVVSRIERMLRRIIGEDIDLATVVQEGLGLVRGDAAQIEQVIMNLAVNARDAMPGGGRLTLEISNVTLDAAYGQSHMGVRAGEYVMLAVSDNGQGIPPELRAHLFEPFFTTKGRGKGTGLGLSTVYGIVRQSGGQIWVYSELGKGTTFKIYLPRVRDGERAESPAQPVRFAERGTETVLLVEDEIGVRSLVRDVLGQHGYTVLEAEDVDDALRFCREHGGEIHLLLTDVVMPIMSGRELAERAADIRPELKVLYMSGYTDNVVIHHGVKAHETQFLQKPFTPRLLARKVREVLDRRG
jgi:two-component system, cell cycle sensor histidine kinase and response regulator CckA